MQQSYAKLCGVTETVEVVDLVEDSLRLNAGAFVRHGVTLQREFGEVPPINVDKHKVLQILVNLVRNAKYACDDSGRTDKRITLRVGAGAARRADLGDRQRHRHCAGEHGTAVPPRLHHARLGPWVSACTAARSRRRSSAALCAPRAKVAAAERCSSSSCRSRPTRLRVPLERRQSGVTALADYDRTA